MVLDEKWLRAAVMISVAALCSCVAWRERVDPSHVDVRVEAPDERCGGNPRKVLVKIHVRNDSRSNLQIRIADAPGPPYQLSWVAYYVLSSSGEFELNQNGGEGHGPIGEPMPIMEPGDSTVLLAPVYDIGEAEFGRSYRIRINDRDGNTWTTEAFRPCVRQSQ